MALQFLCGISLWKWITLEHPCDMAGARIKLIKKYQPVGCLFTEEMGNVCVHCVYLDWSCVVPFCGADSAHKIQLSSLAVWLDLQ